MSKRLVVGPCSVFGCGRPAQVRGLCRSCYTTRHRYEKAGHSPRKGPRPFQGPCSEPGCGRVALKPGRCRRHRSSSGQTAAGAAPTTRPMLSQVDIDHIRANRDRLPAEQLAEWFNITPSTVVAVQAGRNWGFQRSAPPGLALSLTSIDHIRANRNRLTAERLAEWFNTTPATVVAIQAGRNWGYLRT